MKAISLTKLFTLVCFLLVSRAYAADSCENPLNVSRTTDCRTRFASDNTKMEQCSNIVQCLRDKKEEEDKAKQDKKDKEAECKQALKEYDDAAKKAEEECGRLSVEDIKTCREKADQCRAAMDTSGDSDTSDEPLGGLVRILGTMGQMAGGGNSPQTEGCALQDDTVEKEKERIEDKITKLREDIADLKTKATEADKDFDEKKQKVEEEMLDVEKDFDKAQIQRQTKNQEAAGRIQKAILAAEKKRRDIAAQISLLNTRSSTFALDNMQNNLEFADDRIQKVCREKALELKNKKMQVAVDPKTGRKTQPKFTLREAQQLKKDLKVEESTCLQAMALEKQKRMQKQMAEKKAIQTQIKELEASSQDEVKAIDNEKKQAEALKKISDEEEQKQIEAKFKKLDSLNKSVTDMEKHVAEKKKTFGEKAKAKEDQIQELILKRQGLKPKMSKVTSATNAGKRAAETYLGQCCPGTSDEPSRCKTIRTEFPDIKKPAKPASGRTGTST